LSLIKKFYILEEVCVLMLHINHIATQNTVHYTPIKDYFVGNRRYYRIAVVEHLLADYNLNGFIKLSEASERFFSSNFSYYKKYRYRLHKFDV
jgi:hypothetical protein